MTLIKSISGIRGTIGGTPGDNLTPLDIVKFVSAYGSIIKEQYPGQHVQVVVGRDARKSGPFVNGIVVNTLRAMGIHVLDLGLSTTPTVEMTVLHQESHGGIILTASHNPGIWNALKLLDGSGEFISAEMGERILEIAEKEEFVYEGVDMLGDLYSDDKSMEKHIDEILKLPLVNADAIKNAGFKVVVDGVNSTGGIFVPYLLEKLGVETIKLYCDPSGDFPHNPEPLPEHLTDICDLVQKEDADLGIVVDPDVDRLALVMENGECFGEEYTLVAISDYVLSQTSGDLVTVSNLSSSRALRDVTEKHGGTYYASAVGEVNVVKKMKEKGAVIGGEGNGGIIYPELHYGRDALVGIALFLTHLSKSKMKCSELRYTYPEYIISKNKIALGPHIDMDNLLSSIQSRYSNENINTIDGVKIDFQNEWVHLRKSNTEPIIRIYSESATKEKADALAKQIMNDIEEIVA
ncbi:MAG: phosphoglucosamine mutase [Flavobacteriales bacterium]|nr:phosphoglucosamine mutase [Flavobacteriales bacterium]